MKVDPNTAIVVFGGSQMGKSTFINMICGDHMAAIGDGSGESTTRNVAVYDSRLGPLVDCPGYDDSDLQIHIEDLASHVAIALTEIGATSVKFLIFDSLVMVQSNYRNRF
jgi:GTP-binding protein EngB required for normal cell division